MCQADHFQGSLVQVEVMDQELRALVIQQTEVVHQYPEMNLSCLSQQSVLLTAH